MKLADIIIQVIGGLGIVASVISFQCKKHRSILIFRTLNESIFAVQYFLLGAYTGMIMNLIGSVRNLIFAHRVARGKKTTVPMIIFSVMFVVFGIFFWQGPKSILVMIAKVLSTVAYGNKNTTVVRGIVLVTSTAWLIYNSCVFSIAGVLCEAFTLASVVLGIIRLDLIPHFFKIKAARSERHK